ncbi:hypothetical protein LZZ90_09945 [Flavobacterium sp. SM15]|uniref:hypothetical protein n=1 Tax=Flavobacterium sp. SM15 TaxID=2908005 RepID=UPI001ED9CDA4|nr:hypothetical protein [Flavobacterium sp. SM15]MCG2611825.1 hypothetical protein [Flavobacterium sp. SM15]
MKISYIVEQAEFYETYEIQTSILNYTTPEKEFRVCRYCNSPNSTFKSRAHLIPEFTGNKDSFCFNECDACNNKFGIYETHLSAFSGIKNTFIPIKGKKNFPKFKDKNITTQFVGENRVVAKVETDANNMSLENGVLTVKASTQSFIPLYVYKALTKFGLSMLSSDDIWKFEKAIDWLSVPDKKFDDNNLPLLLIHNEGRPPILKPLAFLAKRKQDVNSPEFTFILAYGFHRLQIFLPFNSNDQNLNSEVFLPLNFDFVTQKMKNKPQWGFGHFEMNWLEKVRLDDNFKINFKPSENNALFK